jgi:cell division protein ZapA (FtsZ GTPase activity inhibitor)
MSTISIKVQIAGRNYPLSIPAEEEALIRLAESKIDANIKAFQDKYGVKDPQDLLAMTLLQMANQLNKLQDQPHPNAQDTSLSELESLNEVVESYLK